MARNNKNSGKTKQSKLGRKVWNPKDAMEAREILRRFVVRASRVEAHSMVRDHSVEKYADLSRRIRPRKGRGDLVGIEMPDQEVFESLAARVRPCVLNTESVFLEHVFDSIDTLLGDRRGEDESRLLGGFRREFEDLRNTRGEAAFLLQSYDTDDTPKGDFLRDWQASEGWMYGDLAHVDAREEKARAKEFPYNTRFCVATLQYSKLAVLVVRLLDFVTDLNARLRFGIDGGAWNEQVSAPEGEIEYAIKEIVQYEGAEIPKNGLDLPTHPKDGTVIIDPANVRWAVRRKDVAEAFFYHGEKVLGKVPATVSWEGDVMTILVGGALLVRLDITDSIMGRKLIDDKEAVARLQPILRESDLVSIAIPSGDGKNEIRVNCFLTSRDSTRSERKDIDGPNEDDKASAEKEQ